MAQEFTSGSMRYKVTDAEEKEVECQGLEDKSSVGSFSLEIPNTVSYNGIGYAVTSVGDSAFYGCSGFWSGFVLPEALMRIGDYAFSGCSGLIQALTIGDAVTEIGDYAFSGCSGLRKTLTIGDAVTEIGDYAFSGCSGLREILTIGDAVTEIGDYAFSGCSGLCGTLTIGDAVTEIGEGAFSGCSSFDELIFSSSVVTIGDKAFAHCIELSIVKNYADVPQSISADVFDGVQIGSKLLLAPYYFVNAYESAAVWKDFRDVWYIDGTQVTFTVTTAEGYELEYGITDFEAKTAECLGLADDDDKGGEADLMIPATVSYEGVDYAVTSIRYSAFSGCFDFTGTLVIPNGVTSIGNAAFIYCDGFTGTLVIPNGVTSIGSYAFDGCDGFTGTLVIPNGVTRLEYCAFSDCDGFEDLELPESLSYIAEGAFGLPRIYAYEKWLEKQEAGSIYAGTVLLQYREDDTVEEIIRETTTCVAEGAFSDCAFENFVIPDCVECIHSDAFYNCRFSGDFIIGDGVKELSHVLFSGYCRSFDANLVLGESLRSISAFAIGDEIRNGDSLYCRAILPPSLDFERYDLRDMIVYVPEESLAAYEEAEIWERATLKVMVEATGVTINETETSVAIDDELTLVATLAPNDVSKKNVHWSSSDKKVATVDNDGVVRGIAEGKVTIKARTADGTDLVATCEVEVKDASSVENAYFTEVRVVCQNGVLRVDNAPVGAEYSLVTLSGVVLNQGEVTSGGNLVIDNCALAEGMYMLVLKDDGMQSAFKVIVE